MQPLPTGGLQYLWALSSTQTKEFLKECFYTDTNTDVLCFMVIDKGHDLGKQSILLLADVTPLRDANLVKQIAQPVKDVSISYFIGIVL